ncbi:type IV toxin-antitoxin system AbiEi family antitoxin [Paractinoplanes globisporus]|uniref:Type IV toxin-antitoxin system AbiEi family antitoxin n=1 Tax=Paractinoplanes globisporus TaxID=113565 RepID=A0ABW6WG34_9ACTN|nr:type IV toxin-antitoxin system AbiEi family antitoxin [Actinoplanes globisporus]
MTFNEIALRPPPRSAYPLLIVGERVSRRSAAALRDAGIQFVDALGNAYLTIDDVLVELQGRTEPVGRVQARSPRAAQPRQSVNIFSARRSQVALALLTWPELATGNVRAVATAAGVSLGQAHDALTQLERAGFLVPGSRRLDRTDDLLDYWAAAYPSGLGRRLELARYHGDATTPVKVPRDDQALYLSGESAKGTILVSPATLTAYVDAVDPMLPIVNRWSASPGRVPNVFIRQKFWVSPLPEEEEPAPGGRNAPWPLVYADLIAVGDPRLNEAARDWRTRRARPGEV